MFGAGRGGGGGGRQVCQFFLQGRCKFGDNCRYEHPQSQSNNNNRFAPLQNQNGGRGKAGQSSQNDNPYGITADQIKLDLTDDRPIWPLSAYQPGKAGPVQLIEGDLEQSPEEMRVMYYLAMAGGNPQEGAAQEAQASAKANEAVQRILSDLNGAVKYCVDGRDKHPNRLDQTNSGNNAQPSTASNPFGGAPAASASPFGQPSNPGQQASPFGKPATSAFGQPSTFGQSSALGKPAASGFGQPSSMGATAPSAFGQPSGIGQSSGFGQPTQMGQKPAFGQSGFGQPAQPAFGQASKPAFGQPAQTSAFGGASPFGQTQQNQNKANPFASSGNNQPSGFAQAGQQQASGFGQPSAFGAAAKSASPFASAGQNQAQSSAFVGNNQSQSKPSPFGQPSQPAFGQPTQPTQSAFGAPAAPAFGQPTQSSNNNNAFGAPPQPSVFGQNTQQPKQSPFGQPSQPQQQTNPFGQGQPANSTTASPFATQQQPTQAAPHAGPDPATYLVLNAQHAPTSFKQRPVRFDAEKKQHFYRSPADNSREERLWFPEGPPTKANADSELEEVFYTGDLGRALEEVYKGVVETGKFGGDGTMPEVPPRGAWVGWDI